MRSFHRNEVPIIGLFVVSHSLYIIVLENNGRSLSSCCLKETFPFFSMPFCLLTYKCDALLMSSHGHKTLIPPRILDFICDLAHLGCALHRHRLLQRVGLVALQIIAVEVAGSRGSTHQSFGLGRPRQRLLIVNAFRGVGGLVRPPVPGAGFDGLRDRRHVVDAGRGSGQSGFFGQTSALQRDHHEHDVASVPLADFERLGLHGLSLHCQIFEGMCASHL